MKKRNFFWIGVVCLIWAGISQTQALAIRSRPGCEQVYQYLLNHMRECPEEAEGNCIPFNANLTRERGLESDGEEVFYCKLEGTSYFNLYIIRSQTGTLLGLGDGDPFELGESRELADVEMRTDKYTHFVYDVRTNEGNSVDLFNFSILRISYDGGRMGPQGKVVYFTQFTVNGVERSAEPTPEPDPDEARCTFLAGGERYEECLANPEIDYLNPGNGGSCPDDDGDGVCNADEVVTGGGPRPPGTGRLRNIDEANLRDGTGAASGGACALNTKATPSGFGLGLLALFISSLVLLRRFPRSTRR